MTHADRRDAQLRRMWLRLGLHGRRIADRLRRAGRWDARAEDALIAAGVAAHAAAPYRADADALCADDYREAVRALEAAMDQDGRAVPGSVLRYMRRCRAYARASWTYYAGGQS